MQKDNEVSRRLFQATLTSILKINGHLITLSEIQNLSIKKKYNFIYSRSQNIDIARISQKIIVTKFF
jgi:hypothetical protein